MAGTLLYTLAKERQRGEKFLVEGNNLQEDHFWVWMYRVDWHANHHTASHSDVLSWCCLLLGIKIIIKIIITGLPQGK